MIPTSSRLNAFIQNDFIFVMIRSTFNAPVDAPITWS